MYHVSHAQSPLWAGTGSRKPSRTSTVVSQYTHTSCFAIYTTMPAQFSPRTMGPTSASGPRAARSAADLHRQPKRNALSHVSHHNTTYSCSSSTMGSNSPSINTSPSAASTHTSPSEHCNHAYPVAFCCLKDLQLNHSTPHQSTSHHCSPATGFTCEQKPLLKVLPRASISTEKPSTAQSG